MTNPTQIHSNKLKLRKKSFAGNPEIFESAKMQINKAHNVKVRSETITLKNKEIKEAKGTNDYTKLADWIMGGFFDEKGAQN